MPFNIVVDSVSQSIGTITFNGSWSGADVSCSNSAPIVQFQWGWIASGFMFLTDEFPGGGNSSGGWGASDSADIDRDTSGKVRGVGTDCAVDKQGVNLQFKTYAELMTFLSGLTPGTPTTNSCDVSGQFIPNTRESLASVTIQYRIQGVASWTESAAIVSNLQGTGGVALAGTIVGLTPGTIYEARFHATRNSVNDIELFSNIGTFVTVSSGPAKVIIVLAGMLNTGRMNLSTQVSARTVIAPQMISTASFLNGSPGIKIISPEMTKLVELEVFMADFLPISADMD